MKLWTAEHDEQHEEQHDEPAAPVELEPPVVEEAAAPVVHQPPAPPSDYLHVHRRLDHLIGVLEQSGAIPSEAVHAVRHIP